MLVMHQETKRRNGEEPKAILKRERKIVVKAKWRNI